MLTIWSLGSLSDGQAAAAFLTRNAYGWSALLNLFLCFRMFGLPLPGPRRGVPGWALALAVLALWCPLCAAIPAAVWDLTHAGLFLCSLFVLVWACAARRPGAWLALTGQALSQGLRMVIAVTALGHCNDEVCAALEAQAHKLWHVSNLFYQEEQLELARLLLSTSHHGKAFFCNSGAEANEACIKLARRYMRKVKQRDAYEIITLGGCFHGRTFGALAATGRESLSDGFTPLPEGQRTTDMPGASQWLLHDERFGSQLELVQKIMAMRPNAGIPFQLMVQMEPGNMGPRLLQERLYFSDSRRDSGWQPPRRPSQPAFLPWLAGLR